MEKNTFGAFLRKKRKQCGLSQYQLGMLLKVSDKAVSKWENDLARPKIQLLYRLSVILGVKVEDLLEGKENSDSDKTRKQISEQRNSLWNKAYNILMDKFGGTPPIEVINRFESEKVSLVNSDIIYFFDMISVMRKRAKAKGCPIIQRGGIGASYVAYLLDATDINPLPAHYYCKVCKTVEFVHNVEEGWELTPKECSKCGSVLQCDGYNLSFEVYRHVIGRNVGFDIIISKGFYEEAQSIILGYFRDCFIEILDPPSQFLTERNVSEIKTFIINAADTLSSNSPTDISYYDFYKKMEDRSYINLIFDCEYEKCVALESMIGIPREDINFMEEEILQELFNGKIDDVPKFGLHSLKLLFERYKPENIADVLKLYGVALCVSAVPSKDKVIYLKKEMNLKSVIVYRDDIFNSIFSHMKKCGYYEVGLAYAVMDNARKGKYYHCGIDRSTRLLLSEIGMSDEYIACLEDIVYLFPKAQGITSVQYTLVLLWYKKHYPEKYRYVFGDNVNGCQKEGGAESGIH